MRVIGLGNSQSLFPNSWGYSSLWQYHIQIYVMILGYKSSIFLIWTGIKDSKIKNGG